MTVPKTILGLVLLLFFFGARAAAQEGAAIDGAAGLRGTVKEPGGNPVSGATVEVANLGTGQNHTTTSNSEGSFELQSLAPGEYEVRVSGNGFASQTQRGLKLTSGQFASVSFTMEPAPPSQEQGSPQRETVASGSAAANRISEEQLAGLPMNGRSYSQLATLQAGVSDTSSASGSRGVGGGNLNIVGSRSNVNNYMLDGINIQDNKNNAPRSAAGVQLGSDAVLQVQVFSANYSAEYGRTSGGALNSISRSGNNEFHATLFEYFRNSKLDSRNFFDMGPEPPPFKRNQFGATVSGPLRKDKTFLLVSFEAMRDRLSETQISRYPDAFARQGLLPKPSNPPDVFVDPNNPATYFTVPVHPTVKDYLDLLYPIPNSARLRGGIAEHAEALFFPTDETFASLRLDHSLSERDGVFIRYSFDDATSHSSQNSSLYRIRVTTRQQYLTLAESHIFNLNTVNGFRFGYTRPTDIQDSVTSLEIPRAMYFFPEAPKFGLLGVTGLSTVGPTSPHPETNTLNTFQFSDDLILQMDSHTTKFGVQVHRYRSEQNNIPEMGGEWLFNSMESFLQGGVAGTQVFVALPGSNKRRSYRYTLFGFYVQDTYNARPGLQFNMGLRYEFATLIHDKDGKTGFLADPFLDRKVILGPMLAGNPSLRAFAPRLSITWSPAGSPNTVLSWGFGMYYEQLLKYAIYRRDTMTPFYNRAVRINFDASPYFPNPVAATAGVTSYEARGLEYWNTTIPTVLRYNFGIQHSFPGDWRAQAVYVGARGNHLYRGYEANLFPMPVVRPDGKLFFPPDAGPINPAFASGIALTNSDAQSFYNALQLSANKSLSHGLSLQASYTYSKSVDDAANGTGETGQYGYMRTLNRGLSDFDIRHRLVVNYFYNLPAGNGQRWWKSGVLSKVFGGWRLGGIFSVRTGTPFTATINVPNPGFLFAASQPDLVAGRSNNPTSGVSAGCSAVETGRPLRAPELYFDPCVFQVPDPGTIGNAGRNTLISPAILSADISLQREFLIDARRHLQFRAEFFNLPNHSNFGKPSSGIFTGTGRFNPSAGRISSTNTTSRQIQFALRFSF